MKLTKIHWDILSMLVDDYFGLWEVIAPYYDSKPDLNQSEFKTNVERAFRELLKENLVCLYRGNSFAGEEVLIENSEIESILSDRRNWEWDAPDLGDHIRCAATNKGEQVYYNSSNGDDNERGLDGESDLR